MDIQRDYHIQTQSGPYRKGMLIESTSIVEVTKKFAKNSLFYKLEVYPNNSFFANSNIERRKCFLRWKSMEKETCGRRGNRAITKSDC